MFVLCFDHTDPWLSWLAWCSFVGVSVNIGFKCGKTESRVGAQRLEQALTTHFDSITTLSETLLIHILGDFWQVTY